VTAAPSGQPGHAQHEKLTGATFHFDQLDRLTQLGLAPG
jgi:hypothetical protein